MTWPGQTPVATLTAGLDRLETCLSMGDIAGLMATATGLERSVDRLIRSGRVDRNHVIALQHRARDLSRLVEAALAGVADARTALARPTGFSSYDALGQSDQVGAPTPRFERRR